MSDMSLKPKTIVILLVTLVVASVLGVYRYQHEPKEPAEQQTSSENVSLEETVSRIAKHLTVNGKEKPAMVMVVDADKMREANPWFYNHASAGDRVLIWSDQAVLYNVAQDRILQVLPLNVPTSTLAQLLESQAPATSTSTTNVATSTPAIPVYTVEIRNASGKAGVGKKASAMLDATKFTVARVGDAKHILNSSLIVASARVDATRAQDLAKQFQGTVGVLPVGEASSTADLVLFIGGGRITNNE